MKKFLSSFALVTVLLSSFSASAATFNMDTFGSQLPGGWTKKDGQAAEYKNSDHNYRIWKPVTVTSNADGTVFVGIKIDHIRGGGGDDHAFVQTTLSPLGRVLGVKVDTKHHDKPSVSAGFGSAVGSSWGPEGAIAGSAAAEVFNGLVAAYEQLSSDSGFRHLPSIVRVTIIQASNSVQP